MSRAGSPPVLRQRAIVACGLLGPLLLVVYFVSPALTQWPYAGASPHRLLEYALSHESLFYAGAWLQATGTLLSVAFFLALMEAARPSASFWKSMVFVTASSLLAVVLVEGAFLIAVPIAAHAGDESTVATSFALSNGVFARVFPLAPASGTYLALGAVLLGGSILPRLMAQAAIALGAAFEIAGLLAIFSAVGLYAAIALSVLQVLWIVTAAISYGLGRPSRLTAAS